MEIDWEKKYNEALDRARALREEAIEKEYVNDYVKDYEAIFPELAESEDEMIRKELIEFLREAYSRGNAPEKCAKWLVWLDESKEQEPISSFDIVPYIDDKISALQDMWREEKVAFDWDDMHEMIEDVARHFYQKEQKPLPGFDDLTPDEKMNHPLYLEGFDTGREVGRVEAEQKLEWSEEDEKNVGLVISFCDTLVSGSWFSLSNEQLLSISRTLKSLRFQPHTVSIKNANKFAELEYERGVKDGLNHRWKPSKEELEALNYAIAEWDGGKRLEGLYALRNDLKKLI